MAKDIQYIGWTQKTLKEFKVLYDKAVRENATTFKYEDHEFLVGYAAYLILFLEEQPLPP